MMTQVKHLKSKICLLGEKAVGKTSLVRRYVLNMFDDHYITTIGTKGSKKEVRELLREAYFYGANGILAVCDSTRRRTLDDLDDWIDGVEQVVGKVPILIAVNKSDVGAAQFTAKDVEQFAKAYECEFLMTSARSGENVEGGFRRLGAAVTDL